MSFILKLIGCSSIVGEGCSTTEYVVAVAVEPGVSGSSSVDC